LYCFLIATHLYQCSQPNRPREGLVVVTQQLGGQAFQSAQFALADVLPFVLSEAVDEERPRARSEYNQRPKSARFALAWTSDSLLDHAASQVGGNQTPLRISYDLAQRNIADAGLHCEPHESPVLEYPQFSPKMARLPLAEYSTKCYESVGLSVCFCVNMKATPKCSDLKRPG